MTAADPPSHSSFGLPVDRTGWRDALGIWIACCVLVGGGCFVLAGDRLRQLSDRLQAAVYWQICFAAALATVLAIVAFRLRRLGLTWTELGWRRPGIRAMVVGILLGLWYTSGVYAGILHDASMQGIDPFAWSWIRLALAPLGIGMAFAEEAIMRGFFMTRLAQAQVSSLGQIVLSGACSATYHAMHDFTWIGFLPSLFLFTVHAVVYVAAGRNLAPTVIAHSLYHVLGAPYLLMFAMAQSG